jgi:hypothetical protein
MRLPFLETIGQNAFAQVKAGNITVIDGMPSLITIGMSAFSQCGATLQIKFVPLFARCAPLHPMVLLRLSTPHILQRADAMRY